MNERTALRLGHEQGVGTGQNRIASPHANAVHVAAPTPVLWIAAPPVLVKVNVHAQQPTSEPVVQVKITRRDER